MSSIMLIIGGQITNVLKLILCFQILTLVPFSIVNPVGILILILILIRYLIIF